MIQPGETELFRVNTSSSQGWRNHISLLYLNSPIPGWAPSAAWFDLIRFIIRRPLLLRCHRVLRCGTRFVFACNWSGPYRSRSEDRVNSILVEPRPISNLHGACLVSALNEARIIIVRLLHEFELGDWSLHGPLQTYACRLPSLHMMVHPTYREARRSHLYHRHATGVHADFMVWVAGAWAARARDRILQRMWRAFAEALWRYVRLLINQRWPGLLDNLEQ